MLRGKITGIYSYIKEEEDEGGEKEGNGEGEEELEERSQIRNLNFLLKL